MGALWALTCYFNPMRWHARLRNYRCFRRHLGVPLVTVEWNPFAEFDLGPADADVLVQVRGGDLMWQKERLLGLAARQLPADADFVAWLDCDVLFVDPTWADRVARALARQPALQPFGQARYLDADETRAVAELEAPADVKSFRDGESVVSSARLLERAGPDAVVDGDLRSNAEPSASRLTRIPGLAWAARRSTLEDVGFFDRAVIGSGDWFWMLGALGGAERWLTAARTLGYAYLAKSSYRDWARNAHARVRGRIGHVDGTILHLYHGRIANRRYKLRHKALSDSRLDVDADVVSTPDGVWRFADPRPDWRELMRSYFLGRQEDDPVDGPDRTPEANR